MRQNLLKPGLALFLLAFVLQLLALLFLNGGRLVYSLDDAYIHLALASNIATGHYGIHPAEVCAPASSVLWPFLLAPFGAIDGAHPVPLIINLLASILMIIRLQRFARAMFPRNDRRDRVVSAGVVILFLLATNALGLVFTGMEHSLQLFLTVLVVTGILEDSRTGKVETGVYLGIVLGPLIRYENLAVSLPSAMYLFVRGHRRAALISGVAPLIALAGFSLFLVRLGLDPLPSSVLIKSPMFSDGATGLSLTRNMVANLMDSPQGGIFSGVLLVVIASALFAVDAEARVLAAWAASMGILHLTGGRFGLYPRYEAYAWAVLLVFLLYRFGDPWKRMAQKGNLVKLGLFAVICLVILFPASLRSTITCAKGSNDIFRQQYQMHRFVTEYWKAPVAVNDIGWVSYRNPHDVLDLWGLGSHSARHLRGISSDPKWIDTLAREHEVRLAMIYDIWFPRMPKGWEKVATLHLGRPKVNVEHTAVSFYLRGDADVPRLIGMLEAFQKTLPASVYLVKRDFHVAAIR